MSKNDTNIMISAEDLERIIRIKQEEKEKEKIERMKSQEKIKKIEKEIKQIEILENISDPNKNILKKELSKQKANVKLKGIIFNVYKDTDKKYTRFIFAAEDDNIDTIEFLICGIDNNINGKNFSNPYNVELNDLKNPTVLFIDGEKFKIYDPNSNNNEESNEEKNKEEIDFSSDWLERLSFYQGSFLQRKSSRNLTKEEINEVSKAIQNSTFLTDTQKFLLVSKIKKTKNFNLKDMRNLKKEEIKLTN